MGREEFGENEEVRMMRKTSEAITDVCISFSELSIAAAKCAQVFSELGYLIDEFYNTEEGQQLVQAIAIEDAVLRGELTYEEGVVALSSIRYRKPLALVELVMALLLMVMMIMFFVHMWRL